MCLWPTIGGGAVHTDSAMCISKSYKLQLLWSRAFGGAKSLGKGWWMERRLVWWQSRMERSSRESWHQRVDVVSLEITAAFQSIVLFLAFKSSCLRWCFKRDRRTYRKHFNWGLPRTWGWLKLMPLAFSTRERHIDRDGSFSYSVASSLRMDAFGCHGFRTR